MQTEETLDLGHGHTVNFTSWRPERAITPEYDHLPDVERYGLLIKHSDPQGNPCMGTVVFNSPTAKELYPTGAKWEVESWVPLTLSPSILCSCGDHGWIKDGYWVPA